VTDVAGEATHTRRTATNMAHSYTNLGEVKAYISRQEVHHRKRTFHEEVVALLKKHGIEFDPQSVV
jgi:hypothetical protein